MKILNSAAGLKETFFCKHTIIHSIVLTVMRNSSHDNVSSIHIIRNAFLPHDVAFFHACLYFHLRINHCYPRDTQKNWPCVVFIFLFTSCIVRRSVSKSWSVLLVVSIVSYIVILKIYVPHLSNRHYNLFIYFYFILFYLIFPLGTCHFIFFLLQHTFFILWQQ